MTQPLRIPAMLAAPFEVFRADLETVFWHWLAHDEETPDSLAQARAALRRYIEDRADPDAYGISREARLRNLFAHFHDLAVRVTPPAPGGVTPVPSREAEARILDNDWLRLQREKEK